MFTFLFFFLRSNQWPPTKLQNRLICWKFLKLQQICPKCLYPISRKCRRWKLESCWLEKLVSGPKLFNILLVSKGYSQTGVWQWITSNEFLVFQIRVSMGVGCWPLEITMIALKHCFQLINILSMWPNWGTFCPDLSQAQKQVLWHLHRHVRSEASPLFCHLQR